MINKILKSLSYRFHAYNSKSIEGDNFTFVNEGKLIGCQISVKGNSNSISIGEDTFLRNTKIIINGNFCRINISTEVTIKSGELWMEDNNSELNIGKLVSIEEAHIAVTEDNSTVSIGEDCMIAKGVEIRNGDSHSIFDNENKRINTAKNVNIKNHVWLGSKSMILKGVEIGNGSIVAAGSIVTKSFDENILIAGIPGKKVNENVTWTRAR